MRVGIVLLCVLVGVLPLCLLNGQTFTNAMIALPLFLAAIALCAAFALGPHTPDSQRRAWRLATMLTALLAFGILLSLPSAYRSQERFNEVTRMIHQARTNPHEATGPGR